MYSQICTISKQDKYEGEYLHDDIFMRSEAVQ